jgi:amino acid transporter
MGTFMQVLGIIQIFLGIILMATVLGVFKGIGLIITGLGVFPGIGLIIAGLVHITLGIAVNDIKEIKKKLGA